MRSTKNIVWISPGFSPSESDDFTIPTLQKLALEFKKHHPEIILRIISIHFPFIEKEYQWHEIPVHPIGGKNVSFPKRFLTWKNVLRKLKNLHEKTKIDLVHSFWLNEPALLASWFCRRNNIPHICTAIGQSARSTNKYLKILPLTSIFKIAESLRGSELLKLNTKIAANAIIAWGIDEIKVNAKNKRHIDIIGVGSLSPVKNYSLFLEIIRMVKNKNNSVNVSLVGDGEEIQKLKDLAKNYGIENNVKFNGWIRRAEVLELMAKSKILLHTSDFEGFGYIYSEARACGCHIVSTPVGTIENSDFSFVSSDKTEMAHKINHILENVKDFVPGKVMTMKDTAEKYAALYTYLIKKQL